MSYKNSKWISPGTRNKQTGVFSGGFADNTPNLYLSDMFSPYLRNARLDGNTTIIRPGHSLFVELTDGDYPRGIGSYVRSNPDNDRIVVRHNQDTNKKLVSIEDDGTITAIDTGSNITSDNRMSFTNIGDVLYCMNGEDMLGKLEGTTYTTPTTGIAGFAPKFSVVFNGSHWASGWSDNGNVVYKSVADDYDDFSGSGSDSFTFFENITGLAVNNEALYYFTKNSVSVTGVGDIQETSGILTYFTRTLTVKEGAVNNASIVEVGNRVYFLTPSNKINIITRGQSIDGYEVYELSERKYAGISKIMSELDSDQSDSFGYFLQKENLIKWHLKSQGAVFNDVCIIYDITKDKWLVDSQKFFFGGISYKDKAYTISMLEPKVYLDEYGQDDEDSPIPFEYWTKEFYFNDPTYKKILRETRTLLDISELAELKQEIRVDGKLYDTKIVDKDNIEVIVGGIGTHTVGEQAIGEGEGLEDEYNEIYILRTKGNLNVKGKKFQFRFYNNTLAGKVRLKHIQMRIELLPEIANNLTT